MDFLAQLSHSTTAVIPLLVLLGTGLALMLLDAFKTKGTLLSWVAAAGLLLSAALSAAKIGIPSDIVFSGMFQAGGIAPIAHTFLALSGALTLFFLSDYLGRLDRNVNDVYALVVFAVLGMVLMANANDLVMTFIGLETMSMCLYIFASLFKTEVKSNESGLKYFLLGSFASAFLLFGISLIYGLTGSTNFDEIVTASDVFSSNEMIFYTAAGLTLIGFLFKIAAFPFHNWTPDVYAGTPTPLAGFMATGSKMAAFIALATIVNKLDLMDYPKLQLLLVISAVVTMAYGNIVAAQQTNIKRMLAYSSIAHSGYVLLGICAGEAGLTAVVFYMFVYTLMNIGAFGMVSMAERKDIDTELESWKGLGMQAPYFAGALAIFLFSLAGIPPLAGFMGKYQVFITAIRADLVVWAIIGILTSVIGAFYYIRVIVLMFFSGESTKATINTKFNLVPTVGIVVLAFLILLLGVFPGLVLDPISHANTFVDTAASAMLGK